MRRRSRDASTSGRLDRAIGRQAVLALVTILLAVGLIALALEAGPGPKHPARTTTPTTSTTMACCLTHLHPTTTEPPPPLTTVLPGRQPTVSIVTVPVPEVVVVPSPSPSPAPAQRAAPTAPATTTTQPMLCVTAVGVCLKGVTSAGTARKVTSQAR